MISAAGRLVAAGEGSRGFSWPGRGSGIAVSPISTGRSGGVSDDSFQARWVEKTYENGALTIARRYTGLFTLIQDPPHDAETLRVNPLGIYVHSLNWGEDLVTGDNK